MQSRAGAPIHDAKALPVGVSGGRVTLAWLVAPVCVSAVLAIALACAGCERPPSAESLQEWSPGDHHSTDDDNKLGARGPAPGEANGGPRRSGESDVAQLVDIAWRQQCINCHGAGGHGDGQMGPMLHAPDLTRADWQATVTDAELVATIKSGKNRMPKFDLPDPVLQGLVARIRSLRGQ